MYYALYIPVLFGNCQPSAKADGNEYRTILFDEDLFIAVGFSQRRPHTFNIDHTVVFLMVLKCKYLKKLLKNIDRLYKCIIFIFAFSIN